MHGLRLFCCCVAPILLLGARAELQVSAPDGTEDSATFAEGGLLPGDPSLAEKEKLLYGDSAAAAATAATPPGTGIPFRPLDSQEEASTGVEVSPRADGSTEAAAELDTSSLKAEGLKEKEALVAEPQNAPDKGHDMDGQREAPEPYLAVNKKEVLAGKEAEESEQAQSEGVAKDAAPSQSLLVPPVKTREDNITADLGREDGATSVERRFSDGSPAVSTLGAPGKAPQEPHLLDGQEESEEAEGGGDTSPHEEEAEEETAGGPGQLDAEDSEEEGEEGATVAREGDTSLQEGEGSDEDESGGKNDSEEDEAEEENNSEEDAAEEEDSSEEDEAEEGDNSEEDAAEEEDSSEEEEVEEGDNSQEDAAEEEDPQPQEDDSTVEAAEEGATALAGEEAMVHGIGGEEEGPAPSEREGRAEEGEEGTSPGKGVGEVEPGDPSLTSDPEADTHLQHQEGGPSEAEAMPTPPSNEDTLSGHEEASSEQAHPVPPAASPAPHSNPPATSTAGQFTWRGSSPLHAILKG